LDVPKPKPLVVVVARENPVVAGVIVAAFEASNESPGVATVGTVLTRLKLEATAVDVVVATVLPSPNPVPVAIVVYSTKSQIGRSLKI
jgi:hypothetical protein